MTVAACSGCAATEPMADRMVARHDRPTHELILPTIHCLSCMTAVEGVLNAQPDISSARVNLTRKRVTIHATSDVDPSAWISALAEAGFDAHESEFGKLAGVGQKLLLRLGVAGFAMMNVMLLSVAVWSGATESTRDLFHWVSAAIALPAAMFCAEPFFSNATKALKVGRLNMDVPISVAILLACGLSLFETINGGHEAYFDAALSLTFFLLAGRFLEQRMRTAAKSAAADLAALEPKRATVVSGNSRTSKPIESIEIGDTLWFPAGSRIPVDAILITETGTIDRSALTGESDPLYLKKGETLYAGDVAMSGPITASAREIAAGSTLRRMIELAEKAESSKSKYTSLADRAAKLYAPLVHGIALFAAIGWYLATKDAHLSITVAIATLIITCPCALGLAVPAVATVATGRLFSRGVLVKSETALERMSEIDTVIFDKTGTLTRPKLILPPSLSETEMSIAKALAVASSHPLATSLVRSLADVEAAQLDNVSELLGKGIVGYYGEVPVRFGSGEWMGTLPGLTLAIGGVRYPIEQSDELLEETIDTVQALRTMGLDLHILTGDTGDKAEKIAGKLGIENARSGMKPDEKLSYLNELQSKGRKILMVGDGLNDTLALNQAWASIAPGTALEASQNAADLVLLRQDLRNIPDALDCAMSARRRILENFSLAAIYNMIAIPIAISGFASPLLAAIAMSASSITVTLNAYRINYQ